MRLYVKSLTDLGQEGLEESFASFYLPNWITFCKFCIGQMQPNLQFYERKTNDSIQRELKPGLQFAFELLREVDPIEEQRNLDSRYLSITTKIDGKEAQKIWVSFRPYGWKHFGYIPKSSLTSMFSTQTALVELLIHTTLCCSRDLNPWQWSSTDLGPFEGRSTDWATVPRLAF